MTTLTQPNQCNTFGASSLTSKRGVAPFNSVLGGEAPILLRNQVKSDQCERDKVMDTFKSKLGQFKISSVSSCGEDELA